MRVVANKPLVESVGERCARRGVRVESAGRNTPRRSSASFESWTRLMRARAALRDICTAHSRRRCRAKCGGDGRRECATKVAWAIVTAAAGVRVVYRGRYFAEEGEGMRDGGTGGGARQWRCTLCWKCVQAGASSGESGTARKMVAARGEAAKAAWAMENRQRHRDAGGCWCVTQVAGGARRVGGARQEEPSRGEVVAHGVGEGEDWEREQRVPRMREIVGVERWAPKTIRGVTGNDGDHVGDKGRRRRRCAWVLRNSAGGTASGAGEGRDSRAAGREQRGGASLAQRRMLVAARDVVGKKRSSTRRLHEGQRSRPLSRRRKMFAGGRGHGLERGGRMTARRRLLARAQGARAENGEGLDGVESTRRDGDGGGAVRAGTLRTGVVVSELHDGSVGTSAGYRRGGGTRGRLGENYAQGRRASERRGSGLWRLSKSEMNGSARSKNAVMPKRHCHSKFGTHTAPEQYGSSSPRSEHDGYYSQARRH
ncbi:hypothetical protein B0H16DRAFT_1486764 [Mycena metata]|uniref:Uncharacterized protein n=1 Tax=Mycena metata TaxID=1033252 RepID=A0AAD7DHI4_9AGAR|nr:hypothetical protein B0H16DRAFT_1486764 [Mycena metata]